jgi:hypothetical protein
VRPSPFIAGAFFALAVGNRTELLMTAPFYLYLFWRRSNENAAGQSRTTRIKQELRVNAQMVIDFLTLPVALVLLTAAYNFARFHSIFDFGYFHIPEVRDEPWYAHGLFSVHSIPWNVNKMIFAGFRDDPDFPFLSFDPFGCSILLSSPFLFLLFRNGGKYRVISWVAIGLLTFILWCHGNPGGWQFSYRYAMILLPWMFLLLTGNGPPTITATEISLFAVSVAINATATWLFLWTDKIQP